MVLIVKGNREQRTGWGERERGVWVRGKGGREGGAGRMSLYQNER